MPFSFHLMPVRGHLFALKGCSIWVFEFFLTLPSSTRLSELLLLVFKAVVMSDCIVDEW